jgi:hypothetical protein
LIWKDGARLREYLKANNIDPVALAKQLPRLRFISPFREPVAHLRGLQKYYAQELPGYVLPSLPNLSPESVARYILSAHADFLNWSKRCPRQFFPLCEIDLGLCGALRLLAFLSITSDQVWEHLVNRFFINDSPPVAHASEIEIFDSLLSSERPRFDGLLRWYSKTVSRLHSTRRK